MKKIFDAKYFNDLSLEDKLNDIPLYSLVAKHKLISYIKTTFNRKLKSIKEIEGLNNSLKVKKIRNLKETDPYVQMLKRMKEKLVYFVGVTMLHKLDEIPDFHKDIYSDMDGLTFNNIMMFLGIVIFREGAKSSLKVFYALRGGCFKTEDLIAFVSEAEDQSIRDILTVQAELEENEIILLIFGELKGKIWNKTELELKNGVYIVAKGMTSKSRGIKHKGRRPTTVFLDDFESEDNTGTEGQRKDVKNRINRQIIPMGKNCKIIFIGTIVHPEAYLVAIKTSKFFRGVKGSYREVAATYHDEDGILRSSWPQRYSVEYFEEKLEWYREQNDEAGYWQEFHNMPAADSRPVFNIENINFIRGKYFNSEGLNFIEYYKNGNPIHRENIKLYDAVDPAFGRKTTNDESVFSAVCETPGRMYGILYNYGCRVVASKQVDEVINTYKKFNSDLFLIESNGAQLGLYNFIRERIQTTGIHMPISKFDKRKSKDKKFKEGLCPIIDDGRLFILIDPFEKFDKEELLKDLKNKETEIKGLTSYMKQIRLLLIQMKTFASADEERDDRIDSVYMCTARLGYPPAKIDVEGYLRRIQVEKMMMSFNNYGAEKDPSFSEGWHKLF